MFRAFNLCWYHCQFPEVSILYLAQAYGPWRNSKCRWGVESWSSKLQLSLGDSAWWGLSTYEEATRVAWQLEKAAVGTKVLSTLLIHKQYFLAQLLTSVCYWENQQAWRKGILLGMPWVSSKPILAKTSCTSCTVRGIWVPSTRQ